MHRSISQISQMSNNSSRRKESWEVSNRVDRVVDSVARNVEWSGGLDSEIKDLTSHIETFNARLLEAYKKNPFGSVNFSMVKKFRTIVDEAENAVENYLGLKKKLHEHKSFTIFLDPRYGRKVKSCASKIQSLKTKMNMLRQEHENDLQSLTINPNINVLLPLQARPSHNN